MKRYEKFFAAEIEIEFKAALYFYSILFFYLAYRFIYGSHQAEISHILSMIATTYIMGYIQVFLLGNYDESEQVTWSVAAKAVLCSFIYAAASWLLGWFDRSIFETAVFFCFVMIFHGCSWWLYSFRRRVSTKELNKELEEFKKKKAVYDRRVK